jgi:NADH-quinone oxidoreductase subunit J
LLRVLPNFNYPVQPADVPVDSIQQIGQSIVGVFVLPFEVASILLLAALVGSIYIARERKKKAGEED